MWCDEVANSTLRYVHFVYKIEVMIEIMFGSRINIEKKNCYIWCIFDDKKSSTAKLERRRLYIFDWDTNSVFLKITHGDTEYFFFFCLCFVTGIAKWDEITQNSKKKFFSNSQRGVEGSGGVDRNSGNGKIYKY